MAAVSVNQHTDHPFIRSFLCHEAGAVPARIVYKNGLVTRHTHDPIKEQSISANNTYRTFAGKNGEVIVGTYTSGANIANVFNKPAGYTRIFRDNKGNLFDNYITDIAEDEKGIIWPESVAPYKVHVVTLGNDESVKQEAEKLYTELLAKNVEVLFDDREASAGAKLADADLIGIPWRVVISKKTLEKGSVELKKRNESEAQMIKTEELMEKL